MYVRPLLELAFRTDWFHFQLFHRKEYAIEHTSCLKTSLRIKIFLFTQRITKLALKWMQNSTSLGLGDHLSGELRNFLPLCLPIMDLVILKSWNTATFLSFSYPILTDWLIATNDKKRRRKLETYNRHTYGWVLRNDKKRKKKKKNVKTCNRHTDPNLLKRSSSSMIFSYVSFVSNQSTMIGYTISQIYEQYSCVQVSH